MSGDVFTKEQCQLLFHQWTEMCFEPSNPKTYIYKCDTQMWHKMNQRAIYQLLGPMRNSFAMTHGKEILDVWMTSDAGGQPHSESLQWDNSRYQIIVGRITIAIRYHARVLLGTYTHYESWQVDNKYLSLFSAKNQDDKIPDTRQ